MDGFDAKNLPCVVSFGQFVKFVCLTEWVGKKSFLSPRHDMTEDEMIELLNRRASIRPTPGMAGVFYRDAPACAALGGGYGQFLWFEGMPGLLEFLRDHAHDMNLGMGPMYMEHQKLRDQAANFTQKAIDGDLPMTALVNQLNIALEGFVEIEWIGLFEELILGLEGFPMKLREEFIFANGSVPSNNLAIPNANLPDFIEFLSSYGV